MNLTADDYSEVTEFLLSRMRNIPQHIYLRHPEGFVTCGGVPVAGFNTSYVKYEQDFEFLANSEFEYESISRINFSSMPNDMAKELLQLYRYFVDRFSISLSEIFIHYHSYLVHSCAPLSAHVTSKVIDEIKTIVSQDDDIDKDIYIYPAPYAEILTHAYKSRKPWGNALIGACSSNMSTANADSWGLAAGIYNCMNLDCVLPLEPSEGFSLYGEIDTEECHVPIFDYFPNIRSTGALSTSMMFTPDDFIELITDVLVAAGFIYSSKSNIVFTSRFQYIVSPFDDNSVDMVSLMNDFLDNPDTWDTTRKLHLARAMKRLSIVGVITDFYKEANNIISALNLQLQNTYIKHLEDEANKLVPPQIIEFHNQYSW